MDPEVAIRIESELVGDAKEALDHFTAVGVARLNHEERKGRWLKGPPRTGLSAGVEVVIDSPTALSPFDRVSYSYALDHPEYFQPREKQLVSIRRWADEESERLAAAEEQARHRLEGAIEAASKAKAARDERANLEAEQRIAAERDRDQRTLPPATFRKKWGDGLRRSA